MPPLPSSPFFPILEEELAREGFRQWHLEPGTCFLARETWWSAAGPRPCPHEGLDLASFLAADGTIRPLPANTVIPAAFAGSVRRIIPDFLGKTVVLRHGTTDGRGWRLHSLYGHVMPLVAEGDQVTAGQGLARLQPARQDGPGPPAHLHLSLAWIAAEFPASRLTWPAMSSSAEIRLVDPLCLRTDTP